MQLSIIICTHNSQDKLPKTLDSILAQDFSDYEVVIVDGASTDGTVEIIKDHEQKFVGRLRWISEKDQGIYQAMNKGVRMAKGEFLNIIGAGDWLEENTLKEFQKCFAENPTARAFYGKTRIWNESLGENRIVQTLSEALLTQPMQHPALYYQKKLHDEFGFYDENYRISADYLFCLEAFYLRKTPVVNFDYVVDNFVSDGISSKKMWLCLREGWRIKQSLKLENNYWGDLKNFLKAKLKNGK